jgi:hypothetical protein
MSLGRKSAANSFRRGGRVRRGRKMAYGGRTQMSSVGVPCPGEIRCPNGTRICLGDPGYPECPGGRIDYCRKYGKNHPKCSQQQQSQYRQKGGRVNPRRMKRGGRVNPRRMRRGGRMRRR